MRMVGVRALILVVLLSAGATRVHAASNTALYSDGTHPTAAGAANLAAVLAPVVNSL